MGDEKHRWWRIALSSLGYTTAGLNCCEHETVDDERQLDSKVERRLTLLFSPADQERARLILLNECGTNIPGWNSAGLDRMQFAVLKLSDGNLDRLQGAVDLAKLDFRDLLMAAGFGDPNSYRSWHPRKKW